MKIRFLVILLLSLIFISCGSQNDEQLIEITHLPNVFSKRDGHFSANITGFISGISTEASYRLNSGDWLSVGEGKPRVAKGQFIIELPVESLLEGENTLEIRANSLFADKSIKKTFRYDPSIIQLPRTITWDKPQHELEVEDGYWSVSKGEDNVWRAHPLAGTEGYDKILVVSGAFPGGRRVETEVIFRYRAGKGEYGFGLLPLWGGRPDEPRVSPKRGWNFSLLWYWSRYEGVGNEFSYKFGEEPPVWVNSYYNLALQKDVKYRVIVEAWPVVDENGNHIRYTQRMKWWPSSAKEPANWVVLSDDEGSPLPEQDYGIAFICYRTQVEYGPVTIKPLPPEIISKGMNEI